jgi:hypothetical protein
MRVVFMNAVSRARNILVCYSADLRILTPLDFQTKVYLELGLNAFIQHDGFVVIYVMWKLWVVV